MHFYGHDIKAYIAHTRHLTPLEDIAYRRMLDLYYLNEEPLQGDAARIARAIDMRAHGEEVATVLGEFFVESDDGWRNSRADEEIATYRAKVETAKRAGRKSAEKRGQGTDAGSDAGSAPAQRPLNDRSTTDQPIIPNPVPHPQTGGCTSPLPGTRTGTDSPEVAGGGGGQALPGVGDGERRRELTLFELLCRSGIRSKAKNRRKILAEIADDLAAQGMVPDQLERLTAKANRESTGDHWALLSTWLDGGAWREKWEEVMSGKAAGVAHRLAAARRMP